VVRRNWKLFYLQFQRDIVDRLKGLVKRHFSKLISPNWWLFFFNWFARWVTRSRVSLHASDSLRACFLNRALVLQWFVLTNSGPSYDLNDASCLLGRLQMCGHNIRFPNNSVLLLARLVRLLRVICIDLGLTIICRLYYLLETWVARWILEEPFRWNVIITSATLLGRQLKWIYILLAHVMVSGRLIPQWHTKSILSVYLRRLGLIIQTCAWKGMRHWVCDLLLYCRFRVTHSVEEGPLITTWDLALGSFGLDGLLTCKRDLFVWNLEEVFLHIRWKWRLKLAAFAA